MCRKDTEALLKKTIHEELTKGLKTIAENHLNITINGEGQIECSFGDELPDSNTKSLKPNMYIVGDLAFYALILGKEGMSGDWCHLCTLPAAEFKDLMKDGDPYTYLFMKQKADEYKVKMAAWKTSGRKTKPKATCGMKDEPWWTFIPLANFIVPLLHCLIGIGDNIFVKFRDIISESIEYISDNEKDTRLAAGSIEELIEEYKSERDTFDKTTDGKLRMSEKGRVRRAKKKVKELMVINSVPGAAVDTTTSTHSPNQLYLEEVMNFINNPDETEDIPIEEDEKEEKPPVPPLLLIANATSTTANTDIQAKINEVNAIIKNSLNTIKPLDKKRKKITDKLSKARTHLKTLKDKIAEYKKDRKKDGDGIESQLFSVLKSMYGITIQAYHGGSLTGKDIQKLMSNADEIFSIFANILKSNKKPGCSYGDVEIDALCKSFANLCILWDGAFSYASKVNPTADDIALYKRYVTAAVYCHVAEGLSITPKVHMMWKHVATQMLVPGGLGQKREDWVEHQHQTTSKERDHYRRTKDLQVRSTAKARSNQLYTHPEVEAHEQQVDDDACRGPRNDYIKVEEGRRQRRMDVRLAALVNWEDNRPNDHPSMQ